MRITWLSGVDARILEYLHDKRFVFTPKVLAVNMERDLDEDAPSHGHLSRRVQKLEAAGLLENYDDRRGMYTLSDTGARYMDQDLPTERIEEISRNEPDMSSRE